MRMIVLAAMLILAACQTMQATPSILQPIAPATDGNGNGGGGY
ncbi:hypothetical protein [Hongsoonwoonella zoysiae]|nr:hypothetical protein [Hongsoonwoonella zoysiae]